MEIRPVHKPILKESQEKLSSLYILIFPARNMIKVGKADDIAARVKVLKPYWGQVDYENSYQLIVPRSVVFKVEKTLHFMLSEYRIESEVMEGYTEIFSFEALNLALKHIQYFIDTGIVSSVLNKGIKEPILVAKKSKRVPIHLKLREKSERLVSDISHIAEQFGRINRLLLILIRKQNRLMYQYDLTEREVIFRVMFTEQRKSPQSDKIMKMFHFEMHSFLSSIAVNCCLATTYSGNVVQYIFRPVLDDKDSLEIVIFLFSQSKLLLSRLPKRSPMLKEDIPVLKS